MLPDNGVGPVWWEHPVPRDAGFLARPVDIVARELLGTLIIRCDHATFPLVGRIVETEAYDGATDQASHAYHGRTTRNGALFLSAGHAYVYQIYGLYSMLSVVTTVPGAAAAVLIRGLELQSGCARMEALRGPGRITRTLGIDRSLDGHDLAVPPLQLVQGPRESRRIVATTRVGLSRHVDPRSAGLAWRFYVLGSAGVSRRDRQAERECQAAASEAPDRESGS